MLTPESLTKNLSDRLRWAWVDDPEIARQIAEDVVEMVWPAVQHDRAAVWERCAADVARVLRDPAMRDKHLRFVNPYSQPVEQVGVEAGQVREDGE